MGKALPHCLLFHFPQRKDSDQRSDGQTIMDIKGYVAQRCKLYPYRCTFFCSKGLDQHCPADNAGDIYRYLNFLLPTF
jgi:hypothetical protein